MSNVNGPMKMLKISIDTLHCLLIFCSVYLLEIFILTCKKRITLNVNHIMQLGMLFAHGEGVKMDSWAMEMLKIDFLQHN